jgi:ribulose-phosphate 3-epimerase
MREEYWFYYILSYFNQERSVTTSQLLHVFQGKRTPSMFYMMEANQWHHGFLYNASITRQDLQQTLQLLLQKQYLQEEKKGYLLTNKGAEACRLYFEAHYYPQEIKTFTYANVRLPFWNQLQLFTQVFSEFSYQNTQYVPVIKHPYYQENIRLLFQGQKDKKETLLKQWFGEQQFLFEQLEERQANVLANLLTGHHILGEMKAQIAEKLQMESLAFDFYLQDILETVITLVKKNASQLVLLNTILKQLHLATNLGLSASTKDTYQLLKKGYTIPKIANIRSIKENTVREHILEMAFVFNNFPYQNFVPATIYQYLNKRFEEEENYHYRQAMQEKDTLEFMHYRLVELERMRQNGP